MRTLEADLVEQAQHGDVEAFEHLISTHQPRLLRLISALAHNHDDAEDALQETLLHAFRAIRKFRRDCAFSTWLYRIALNTTRNWLRSQSRASSQRIATRLLEFGPDPPPRAEDQLVAQERRTAIRDALTALPDHYRDVILLRHYDDMPYEQIADVLHIPIGTVRSRLAQARQIMLTKLAASPYFPNATRR